MVKSWFNNNGALKREFNVQFEIIEQQLIKVFQQLEGRISYRDMYDVAHQAGQAAVAGLVRDHVNSKPLKRKR